ncbi:MAG: hypothetical protein AAB623_01235 [Patescibacteria group bacterium]
MTTTFKKHYYFLLILILLFGVVFTSSVFALTISPVKMELSGDPGQTLQNEFTLFNEQNNTETLYSSVENFESRGESGAPFFLPERVGLATWIKTQEQVTLKPKETKTIPFSIIIPKNAEPGGHFAAILWGMTPPDAIGGGQVAIGGRLGVLILLKVSGEVKEGGGLLDFGGKEKQRFFSSLPITLNYRFNNIGGNRVVPLGEVKIKNSFGFTTTVLSANKNEGSVLPGSARKFEVIWAPLEIPEDGFWSAVKTQWSDFHFGWYTARMNLVWGATNQTANASYNFFIIPWQLLLIIFIILAVFGFLGRMGLKKYNHYIITQARQQK